MHSNGHTGTLLHVQELNEIRSIIKPAMPRSAIRSGLRALLKGTRDWLVEEVDTWIKAAKEKAKDKVFLFTAGPGMG